MVRNLETALKETIKRINKTYSLSLAAEKELWGREAFEELKKLKALSFMPANLFFDIFLYALANKNAIPATKDTNEKAIKNLVRYFFSVYPAAVDSSVLRKSKDLISDNIDTILSVFLTFVGSIISASEKQAKKEKERTERENEQKQDLEKELAELKANPHAKFRDLRIEILTLELQRLKLPFGPERHNIGRIITKRKQELAEKEASSGELTSEEKEALEARIEVQKTSPTQFCTKPECGKMLQAIRLDDGKLVRLCISCDRQLIAKVRPELLEQGKAVTMRGRRGRRRTVWRSLTVQEELDQDS